MEAIGEIRCYLFFGQDSVQLVVSGPGCKILLFRVCSIRIFEHLFLSVAVVLTRMLVCYDGELCISVLLLLSSMLN